MRTSATGTPPRTAAERRPGVAGGFTLLELLIVVFVVALLASVTALSIDGLGSRRAEQEAERLAALINLARDEAVLGGRDLGLRLEPERIAFVTWQQGADGRGIEWRTLDDDPQLRPRAVEPGIRYEFEQEGGTRRQPARNLLQGNPKGGAPQLLFLTSGETDPFLIRVRAADDTGPGTWVRGDADGVVKVEPAQ